MARGKFVSYLRVSTDKQGRSGLGREAQRAAVDAYLNGGRWTLVAEYVETESGRRTDRPQLAKALAHAKAIGATVVFAKLDRLARNVDLLRSLVASDVDLAFCDLPHDSAAGNRPAGRGIAIVLTAYWQELRRELSRRLRGPGLSLIFDADSIGEQRRVCN